ncbi:MAG: carbohydrate binding domain-containing protein [Armatimonadota bacterium]
MGFVQIILLGQLGSGVCAAELCVNPGFETGAKAPWSQNYNGTEYTSYAVTSSPTHSGSYSLVGTAGIGGAGSTQAPVAVEQINIPLQPNKLYSLSFWYKTAWQNYAITDVRFVTVASGGAATYNHLDNLGPATNWTRKTLTLTTGPNVVAGGPSLSTYQGTTGDKIWFDDFSVVESQPSLNNTGFDNSSWVPWIPQGGGGLTWSLTSVNPHWGTKCALATGGSTVPYEGTLRWKDTPVYADTDYRFSLWVKNSGSNWGVYGADNAQNWFKTVAEEADSSGNWGVLGSHDLTQIQASIPGWIRLVTDFSTSPTTTQVRITIKGHLSSAANTIAFDDVALTLAKVNKVSWMPFDKSSMFGAIDAGAELVGLPVRWTNAYYPSAYFPPDATYGDGTALRETVQYAHDRGVMFVGGLPPCLDPVTLTAHPEWRRRYSDSTSWLTAPADQVTGCLVSPYGDFLIDELKETAQVVGMDGVSFDGYDYLPCYCDYCKAKYLADTGHSLPTASWIVGNTVNYDDSLYREYIFWQDAQIIAHMNKMKAGVRTVYPKFEFFIWSTNGGRYGHYLQSPRVMPTELNSLFDCAMQEWWHDESNIGLSVIPDFGAKYLGAVSRGTQWMNDPYLFTHVKDMEGGVFASSMPDEEVMFRALSTIAAGSITNWDPSTSKGYMMNSVFAAIEARRPWTHKAVSMPYAALLVSEPTRQFYGRANPVNLYMNNCFGYFSALQEQHIPVDIITHTDLRNGLALNYKVLVMPNTACMSTADVTAVRAFVSAGGGLVATGVTSLYDDQGVVKTNYALTDLFKANRSAAKVTIQSKATLSETLFSRNSTELGKLLSPTGRTAAFSGEVFPVTVRSGGVSMGIVCTTTACSSTYPLYITNNNTGLGGKVAFFPAALDAGYFSVSYPYEAILLKDALTWVAPSPPPITIVGPKSLQVTFFTQNSGKRLVVHLLNANNSNAGRGYGANDVPVRDEVVPIHNIEVWFEKATPTAVKLQPENLTLTPVTGGGRTKVVVSTLNVHSMVVADIP